jgi:hypothetical protein
VAPAKFWVSGRNVFLLIRLHIDFVIDNMNYIGFEVLMAVNTESTVSWVITLCNLEVVQHFGERYHHLQSQRVAQAIPAETNLLTPTAAGFFIGLLFDPDDEGDTSL